MSLKDDKVWRWITYVAVRFSIFLLLLAAGLMVQAPQNRGQITVAEFCENYRYLEDFYGFDGRKILDKEGKWIERKSTGNNFVIYLEEGMHTVEEKQDFSFEISEDGYVKAIEFTISYTPTEEKDNVWVPTCQEQMQLAALAFVGAQKEFRHIMNENSKLATRIAEHIAEDFSFTMAGITVKCEVEIDGQISQVSDFCIINPTENGDCSYFLHFSMQKK